MTDRIVLLGVKGGPAVRSDSPMPTANLLQIAGRNLVIDCGIGVTRSLADAGLALTEIDCVFITHLHSDHVLELGPLLYTVWTTGLKRQITIYGPVGTQAYWEAFLQSMAFDHDIRVDDEGRTPIRELVRIATFGEGHVAALDGLTVDALRVAHPPVTDTFALRFEHGGRRVIFSADTAYFPPLAAFASGADILVHEAMLTEGVDALVTRTNGGPRLRAHLMASHTPAADAGRIAAEAQVGHLVLNHLVPVDDPGFDEADWRAEVEKNWSGLLTIGKDGMDIPIRPRGQSGHGFVTTEKPIQQI